MRYVCCWILRVFVADFGRSEVDFLAFVYAQGGPLFFQNPPQLRREMRDFGKSNGKDKGKGMENGRTVRLSSKRVGFYCGYPSFWADFLRFVYRGVDCATAWGARTPLEISGVIHA